MKQLRKSASLFLQNNFSRDILVYGGVEAAFWTAYSAVVFLSTALADYGFTSAQTGTIMAVRNIIGMIATAIVANLSDRIGSPRRMMLICTSVAAVTYVLIPAVLPVSIAGLSLGVIVILLSSFFNSPMYGLCESWVVQAADTKKTFTYGKARYFGSFFYAIASILYGVLAKKMGGHLFTFYAFSLLCIPVLFLAVYTKRDEPKQRVKRSRGTFGFSRAIRNYYLVTFLICYTFSSVSMQGLMTFLSYKLLEVAGTTAPMGALTALRSLSEIPSLVLCALWIKKIGLRNTYSIVVLGFCAVQLMLFFATGLSALWAALFLIGFVNGAYMVCQIRYVHAVTPPEARATGVSLCVSVAMISGIMANFVGGYLSDAFGSTNAYFLFAAACALFSLLLFALCVPIGKKLGFPAPNFDTNI